MNLPKSLKKSNKFVHIFYSFLVSVQCTLYSVHHWLVHTMINTRAPGHDMEQIDLRRIGAGNYTHEELFHMDTDQLEQVLGLLSILRVLPKNGDDSFLLIIWLKLTNFKNEYV